MTRTDVHSPKNLITEDYEFVGCGWFGSGAESGFSPLSTPYGQKLLDEGWHFAENESAGGCYHCGARLKYYAILQHIPSHTLVRVGETCLDNRFDRSTALFQQARKTAQLDREARRIEKIRTVWFAIDEDREVAYNWAAEQVDAGHYGYENLRYKFFSQVRRYGSVSDKFVRATMRDMVRTERIEAERAAEKAAEITAPVIEGRIEIAGEVLSVKAQENDFGTRMVVTVRDDRGFKVWGTAPRTADGYYPERGDHVEFVATVEKSDRDETFGFFKRPSKARILEMAA